MYESIIGGFYVLLLACVVRVSAVGARCAWTTTLIATAVLLCGTITKFAYPPNKVPTCGYRCFNMFYPSMVWFTAVGLHQWLVAQRFSIGTLTLSAVVIGAYGRTMRYAVRYFLVGTAYEPSGHISIQVMVAVLADLAAGDAPLALRAVAFTIVITGNWWTVYQFHTAAEAWVGWVMGLVYALPLVYLYANIVNIGAVDTTIVAAAAEAATSGKSLP